MGHLSTHVLDTARGLPAQDVAIELHVLEPGETWRLLKRARTDADGRTAEPLLAAEAMKVGTYMLTFHVGDYFHRLGLALSNPPFLDVIPLRFAIADADGHYHVPLLASPWSYATYRGS